MKKLYKFAVCSSLILSMAACTAAPTTPTEEPSTPEVVDETKTFTEFLDEMFKDELTSDFTTLQQFLENPESYGINRDEVEVNLGKICTDEEDVADLNDAIAQLHSYNKDELSEREQVLYDQLDYQFALNQKLMDPKFDTIGNIWGSLSGLHENLVTFFSEYTVKEERDIVDLITLIEDVPRYVDDALEYTKKQAKNKELYFDYDTVIENIKEIIDTQENSSIYQEIYDEIDEIDLDSDKEKQYKADVKNALDECFFPSYQTMYDTLTSLKKNVKPLTGLANIKNGKEYYLLLLQNATGSTESIEQIEANLEEGINSAESALYEVYREDPLAYLEMSYISTNMKSIEDILPFLKEAVKDDFPAVDNLDYKLSALSDDQSTSGVVAYCVTPAIDSTKPIVIRYNKRDYGSEPDGLDIYTTLGHEGIPGHLYQNQYIRQHMIHPIECLLNNLGFTEGYATYVQFYVTHYIEEGYENAMTMYKCNEILTDLYVAQMDIDIHYHGLSLKEFNKKYAEVFGSDLSGLYNQLADNPTSFLSYYYGYLQIMNLRAHAKEELQDKFTNIEFNDALLNYGNVNFNLIAQSIENYINAKK